MKRRLCFVFIAIVFLLAGCEEKTGAVSAAAQTDQAAAQQSTETAGETASLTELPDTDADQNDIVKTGAEGSLYLLLSTDTVNGLLHVRNIETGEEADAFYSGATVFSDKYGTMVSLAQIHCGDAVTLAFFDSGILSDVQLTDQTWSEKDASDYTIDLDRMIFTLHGSNYRLKNDVPVYTDGKDTGLYSIQEGDRLNVTGLDRDILSMTIVTGTGTIELRNIGVFLDGWLNLDNAEYLKITENMEIPAAEGTHVLTVANDGWGDSTVVAVKRGQSVSVDLSALKGEGPKYCELRVLPDAEGATVYLDGKKMDPEQAEQVRYGLHALTITAEGYEDWQSRLLVNSPSAEIEISLSPEGSSQGKTNAGAASSQTAAGAATPQPAGEGAAGSLAGSLANSGGAGAGTRREAEQAAAETALETLTGMLDTLTGTPSASEE
ncbi:MAG: PEGA domain-containing protein [Lachnospiraceae bacterium]|nr:PEGA domain-containing protein [Lachnospiraceae bacterium]